MFEHIQNCETFINQTKVIQLYIITFNRYLTFELNIHFLNECICKLLNIVLVVKWLHFKDNFSNFCNYSCKLFFMSVGIILIGKNKNTHMLSFI